MLVLTTVSFSFAFWASVYLLTTGRTSMSPFLGFIAFLTILAVCAVYVIAMAVDSFDKERELW